MRKTYYNLLTTEQRSILSDRWANDLNSEDLESVTSSSEAWWRWESCSHVYVSSPARELSRKRCPVCSGSVLVDGVNDMGSLRPDLVLQYSSENAPAAVSHTRSSSFEAVWECGKPGHRWVQEVKRRWAAKTVCPVCEFVYIVPGVNDFLTLNPHLAESWDFELNKVDPHSLSSYSASPAWWRCELGHAWEVSVLSRVKADRGCRVCSGKQVLSGFNDFATVFPEKVNIWVSLEGNPDPSTVLYNTNTVTVNWRCEEGHIYSLTPHAMTRGRGCPYCGGSAVWEGFNDLASKAPDSLSWWDYRKNELTPQEVPFSSHKKFWFRCVAEGHSYDASCYKFYDGKRCPYCAGKRVDESNSLESGFPELMKDWDYANNAVSPGELTRGSSLLVNWKCHVCSHKWVSPPYNRTKQRSPHGCPKCARGVTSSKGEKELYDFVVGCGVEKVERNVRLVDSTGKEFEVDIYVPGLKIGIEFNGVYYHSEKFIDKDYHRKKWLLCESKGIQLIQIWEDDWVQKREIVERMLAHKLGKSDSSSVYARKCLPEKLTTRDAFQFLNENHIQGAANGSLYYGLKHEGELVAVLAVMKEQGGKVFNIVRYATNARVVGGFTKLLRHLERSHSFDQWLTFSDNCLSDGSLYSANGFVKDRDLPPDYSYLAGGSVRKHKFGFRLVKFRNSPDLIYEEGKTERELAVMNGLLRVYDAGKIRWVKTVSRNS